MRQLAIAQKELSIVAATDSLTAVFNRGAFSMLVEAYLEQARDQTVADTGGLLIVDADHFKSINDRLGHDCGDEALKLIARTIQGQLHGADIVGRIGGEEFAVLFRGKSLKDVQPTLEALRETVEATPFILRGRRRPRAKPNERTPSPSPGRKARKYVSVTVSIGVAERVDGTEDPRDVIKAADEALYRAKGAGRNQVKP